MSHNLQKTHREAASKMKAPPKRYEIRWSNGHWGIFDTHEYKTVEIVYPNLRKVAQALLDAPVSAPSARNN
jgi:hypothetical protein